MSHYLSIVLFQFSILTTNLPEKSGNFINSNVNFNKYLSRTRQNLLYYNIQIPLFQLPKFSKKLQFSNYIINGYEWKQK